MPDFETPSAFEVPDDPAEKRTEISREAEEAKIILNAQINANYVARSLSYANEGFMEGMNLEQSRQPPYSIDSLQIYSYIRRKCMVAGKEETLVYRLGVGSKGIPNASYSGPMNVAGRTGAMFFVPPGSWTEFCPIGSAPLNDAIRYLETHMRAFEKRIERDPGSKAKPGEDLTSEEIAVVSSEMEALVSDTSDPTRLTWRKAEESAPEEGESKEVVISSEDLDTMIDDILKLAHAKDTSPKEKEWSEKIFQFPAPEFSYFLKLTPIKKGDGYAGMNVSVFGKGPSEKLVVLLSGGSSFDRYGKDGAPFKDLLKKYVGKE